MKINLTIRKKKSFNKLLTIFSKIKCESLNEPAINYLQVELQKKITHQALQIKTLNRNHLKITSFFSSIRMKYFWKMRHNYEHVDLHVPSEFSLNLYLWIAEFS
jgi:hypothetical protein